LCILNRSHDRLNHPTTHRLIGSHWKRVVGDLLKLDVRGEQRCRQTHAAQLKVQPWYQLSSLKVSMTVQKREAQHRAGIREEHSAIGGF
tara:strand:- start:386 stop:652 length:267 start_codon:yes stop_codon:yes gene_type:complete